MRIFLIAVGIILSIALVWIAGKGCLVADKVTNVDNAFINYEQFQEIYNTCKKVNTDLGIMKNIPETDKMFEQFSKPQRVSTLQTQLNRWVEEYNAKSKMWHKNMWKSKELPYQLTVNQFNNY